MQFVHWPVEAFQRPADPLRVEIIGLDPFEGLLEQSLVGKTVDDRRVVVTHVADPTLTPLPHVAVVSRAGRTDVAPITPHAVSRRPRRRLRRLSRNVTTSLQLRRGVVVRGEYGSWERELEAVPVWRRHHERCNEQWRIGKAGGAARPGFEDGSDRRGILRCGGHCRGRCCAATAKSDDNRNDKLNKVRHIVVIYEENHSFDNLYGGWEGVNGRANAHLAHTLQVGQSGTAYTCLQQNDVNLTSPPLSGIAATPTTSTPLRKPFSKRTVLNRSVASGKRADVSSARRVLPERCLPGPTNLPGGCTRDIVHRFYQEQYQINGGQPNRYTTGSDALGLTQFYYDTQALPIYQYLHGNGHPHYAIADNFFQGVFGGSFLNHQWLIAAAAPTWPGAPAAQHSLVDTNGMPTAYSLYTPTSAVFRPEAHRAVCLAAPGGTRLRRLRGQYDSAGLSAVQGYASTPAAKRHHY